MSGYTKLFGSILESTVWREKDHVRLVWITMLAMADRDGVVEASVPGLADRARTTEELCDDALARLSAPDKRSRTKDYDGRRIAEIDGGWRLLNYEKYRDKANIEESRAKAAARQQRARDRKTASRLVTQSHAPSPIPYASGDASEIGSEIGSDAREADPGRETQCPLDLHMIADTNGTLVSLAEKLSVPLDSIRHESRQFVAYWTIGKGAGQRRTGWMGRLRQRIVEQHGKNQLTAVGAIEHEKPKRAPRQLRSLASATLRKPPERPSMISPIDAEELQRRVDAAMRGET